MSPLLQLVQNLHGLLPDLPGVCPSTLGELLFLLSVTFSPLSSSQPFLLPRAYQRSESTRSGP